MKQLDALLSRVTMYRLVVYVLAIYVAAGIAAALFGHLSSSATAMIVSLVLLLASAYLTDRGFARLFNVPTNSESWLITALILFLILHPAESVVGGVALVLAGAVSSASKFLLAWRERHIFNPAALAASLLSLTALQVTTWWIGSSIFWPLTLVLGLVVVRKVRRFTLVLTFVAVSILLQTAQLVAGHEALAVTLHHALLSSPLIFLSTIMLTEPATMPPRRNHQIIFGGLIAILYAMAWRVGPFIIYPEVALLIGNVYAYIVAPKFNTRLVLKEIKRVSERVYTYSFTPDRRLSFLPGQYMEWTLPGVPFDSRGNRRAFTIASSPTEATVQLGIKYYEPASAFKATFAGLRPGSVIYAGQLAGNFTLAGNESKKLAFIAGGIGITPFRSMVKYLSDMNLRSDIVVLYAVTTADELAYLPELREAVRIGVRVVPVVASEQAAAPGVMADRLSSELIARLVPDYAERDFYISGPNVMVDAVQAYLRALSVPRRRIKTDHFSGY